MDGDGDLTRDEVCKTTIQIREDKLLTEEQLDALLEVVNGAHVMDGKL